MDVAPHALDPAAPVPAAPAPIEAPSPTSITDLDRAAVELADRAGAFARIPPREKAALLRAMIPGILAVAPEMVAETCHIAGLDPKSPRAGAAWLAGPVSLIAAARCLAAALEDIASSGRPSLPASDLRGRLDGRVMASLEPRSFAEGVLHRSLQAAAVFHDGVEPEDVIAGQAIFYRRSEPPGGVAFLLGDGTPAAGVLHTLFVEGRVALLEMIPARSRLGPLVERALGPLCEAGFLRVVHGGDVPGAHLSATLGEPTRAAPGCGGPVIIVPALYARDELWFVARRLASAIAAGAAFNIAAPGVIVLSGCWAQRRLFFDLLGRALAAVPRRGSPWALVLDPEADLPAGAVGVVTAGCDDPVEMLSVAVDRFDARYSRAAAAEIVVHPVQEEDAEIAAALRRAVARLRHGAVGINQWPALVAFRGDAPWGLQPGARMFSRIDKVIVRGPLRTARRPAYFYDNPRGPRLGARLAAFHAAPGVGTLLRVM